MAKKTTKTKKAKPASRKAAPARSAKLRGEEDREKGREEDGGQGIREGSGEEGRQADQVRLLLRQRQSRRRSHDEGYARRQGREPRRDDQRGPARASRIHHLHRRLPPLLRARPQGARQHRRRDGGERQEDREGGRRAARLGEEPAARLGPLGREVLDARHDGHDPEPRPQRRDRRGPQGAHRQRPLRLRQLPPLHPDVRQRRARNGQGDLRARLRRA